MDSDCYAAAFFDAEGSVVITHGKRGWSRAVQVVNTDRSTVYWFKQHFGGHVYRSKNRRLSLGRKPVYVWKAYSFTDLNVFIRSVAPHLKQKLRKVLIMNRQIHGDLSYAEARRRLGWRR